MTEKYSGQRMGRREFLGVLAAIAALSACRGTSPPTLPEQFPSEQTGIGGGNEPFLTEVPTATPTSIFKEGMQFARDMIGGQTTSQDLLGEFAANRNRVEENINVAIRTEKITPTQSQNVIFVFDSRGGKAGALVGSPQGVWLFGETDSAVLLPTKSWEFKRIAACEVLDPGEEGPLSGLFLTERNSKDKVIARYQIRRNFEATGTIVGLRAVKIDTKGDPLVRDGKLVYEDEEELALITGYTPETGVGNGMFLVKGDFKFLEVPKGKELNVTPSLNWVSVEVELRNTDGELVAVYDPFTGKIQGDKEAIWKEAEAPSEVLRLEGFDLINNQKTGRWEYVDANGKTIAYWDTKANEGKGKIELAEGVKTLDLEKHRGIIENWSFEAAYDEYVKTGKIPITVTSVDGKGIIGEGSSLAKGIGFAGLSEGSSIYALFDGNISPFATSKGSRGFFLSSKELNLTIRYFCDYNDLPITVNKGERITTLGVKLVGGFSDPLFKKAEVIIAIGDGDYTKSFDLDFDRLMRNPLTGKLIRIGGPPSK